MPTKRRVVLNPLTVPRCVTCGNHTDARCSGCKQPVCALHNMAPRSSFDWYCGPCRMEFVNQQSKKGAEMKLGETFYCNDCGSKIASGNHLCEACRLDKERTERGKQRIDALHKEAVAKGEQMAGKYHPHHSALILSVVYGKCTREAERQALAHAVYVLMHQDSPKKNQPLRLAGDEAGFETQC